LACLSTLAKRLDEIGIGFIERATIEARMRIELGTEIEVVVLETLERVEIVVVINSGKAPADLPELVPLCVARKRSMPDKRIQEIVLADGNELLAPQGHAGRVSRHAHCGL
jgi:hypothetical protein